MLFMFALFDTRFETYSAYSLYHKDAAQKERPQDNDSNKNDR